MRRSKPFYIAKTCRGEGKVCEALALSPLGAPPREEEAQPAVGRMFCALLAGKSLAEAAEEALEAGYGRNEVYQARLTLKEMFEEE